VSDQVLYRVSLHRSVFFATPKSHPALPEGDCFLAMTLPLMPSTRSGVPSGAPPHSINVLGSFQVGVVKCPEPL
jgi:hypothetical protein